VGRDVDGCRGARTAWASRDRGGRQAARRQGDAEGRRKARETRRPSRAPRPTSARQSSSSIWTGERSMIFGPRHLRVVGARDMGLDPEETGHIEPAALLAHSHRTDCGVNSSEIPLGRRFTWLGKPFWFCDNCGKRGRRVAGRGSSASPTQMPAAARRRRISVTSAPARCRAAQSLAAGRRPKAAPTPSASA